MDNESARENRYRQYMDLAEQAELSASRAKDHQAKLSFKMLADGWRQLAKQVLKFNASSD